MCTTIILYRQRSPCEFVIINWSPEKVTPNSFMSIELSVSSRVVIPADNAANTDACIVALSSVDKKTQVCNRTIFVTCSICNSKRVLS